LVTDEMIVNIKAEQLFPKTARLPTKLVVF